MASSEADDGPPMTVKQRMALLQRAAILPSSTSKQGSPGPIVHLGSSAAQDSLASALRDDDHLSLPKPTSTTTTNTTNTTASIDHQPPPLSSSSTQPPNPAADGLAAYQPLSPTASPLPSRTSSPIPTAAGRTRAFSTASTSSTSSRTAGLTRTQALAGGASGIGLLPSGGRTRSSSASSTAAPELTRLSIAGTVATKQAEDRRGALSPVLGSSTEGRSGEGEGAWTAAPVSVGLLAGSASSRGTSAVAALQAVPEPAGALMPPKLPPRRNTITDGDIPMTRTNSANSLSAPALPPRPRATPVPSATLPPTLPSITTATPPALPARSRTLGLGALVSSTSSVASTPPRRHLRPIAGSEFESVDLGSPASASPVRSLSTASLASSLHSSGPAALRPPHLVRSGSYASSLASGSGATPPASPTSARTPTNGTFGAGRRPVDPRARWRYEALFDAALRHSGGGPGRSHGKGRAGDEAEERLDGLAVRRIWIRSRLEGALLHGVWDACDGERHGAVGRDAFCRGMGAIDDELGRRASGRRE